MEPKDSLLNWLFILCLALLLGTSFLFTSISVESVDPISVVFYRVLTAAFILCAVVFVKGLSFPRTRSNWLAFFAMGFVGNVFPFFLITWGQLSVNSSIAGMIMGIVPLMTMLLAHYHIEGENLNRYKVIGFIFGITGIAILLGPVFDGGGRAVFGSITIFIAATSYAVNTVLVKRLPQSSPMVGAAGVMIGASIIMLPIWLLQPTAAISQLSLRSINSMIWLGIGPTAIATIILFVVIERAGPTFLSTINYMIPVVAFFAGAVILSEPVACSSVFALMIILSSIALTRFRMNQAALGISSTTPQRSD